MKVAFRVNDAVFGSPIENRSITKRAIAEFARMIAPNGCYVYDAKLVESASSKTFGEYDADCLLAKGMGN